MSLIEDYSKVVEDIFKEKWSTREGRKVPESEELGLGNDAVKLDGTVLYADLDASTNLVDSYKPEFAAEIYKTYLHCAAKVIRSEGVLSLLMTVIVSWQCILVTQKIVPRPNQL